MYRNRTVSACMPSKAGSQARDRRILGKWWGSGALAAVGLALIGSTAGAAPTPAAVAAKTVFAVATPVAAAVAPGDVVAVVELGAPTVDQFVLRATVPVPPNTYPRPDGLVPFSIRQPDGAVVKGQVEHVASHPVAADGSSVIEVIAVVQRPAGATPDTRVQYEVIRDAHPVKGPVITQVVRDLMVARDSMVLATKDSFGHEYRIDLRQGKNGIKTLRVGRWLRQLRFYGVMRPVSPNKSTHNGTLDHMFGVHSYVTTYDGEDVISIDLRLHNGPSGKDKSNPIDDPNHRLYFESLRLLIPNGWTLLQAFDDPMYGAPYKEGPMTAVPIVEPNADGSMHVFPVQGQMERRLVLTPIGNEARALSILREEGLAFVLKGTNPKGNPLWSWWNSATANYFPQRHALPDLSHIGAQSCRGKMNGELSKFSNIMATGSNPNAYPIHTGRLGWAHPWGVKYGGMTSGSEIFLYDGMTTAWGASNSGYRMAQLTHRMYTDRHPTALFNKNGEPTSLFDWVIKGPNFDYVHMNFYMKLLNGNDPFGFKVSPKFQSQYVSGANLKPDYEAELLAHDSIDLQHLIRYTRSPKILAWLGNDAMAKDDLLMQAELARLSYHDLYTSPGGGATISGLLADIQFVNANPSKGFAFGRGEGWAMDVMTAAYALGTPTWRNQALPWFEIVVDTVLRGQSRCNGFIQAIVSSKMFANYRARQSIEAAIVENALWGVKESVFRGVDKGQRRKIETIVAASVRAMIQFPSWDSNLDGPVSILAVGPLNLSIKPFCGTLPSGGALAGIDKFQVWSSYAYGYELTGNKLYLQRAMEMNKASNLRTSLENANYGNLENRAALLSLTEYVNYP